jgi:hypothetical protein
MSWTTKNGAIIDVKDMEISHVTNVLKMLVKNYTTFCINHGARYIPSINIVQMNDEEKRDLLTKHCQDARYLKILILKQCFDEDIYNDY